MSSTTRKYLPIEVIAEYEDTSIENIKSLSRNNTFGNDIRFKKIDNKLYVLENHKAPLANELNELREKALIIAKTENNLCYELSLISNLKQNTIQQYFYRFTFKRIERAMMMINLLKNYINQNSLFPVEDLQYD